MTRAYRRSPVVKSHGEEQEERRLEEWLQNRTKVSQDLKSTNAPKKGHNNEFAPGWLDFLF